MSYCPFKWLAFDEMPGITIKKSIGISFEALEKNSVKT